MNRTLINIIFNMIFMLIRLYSNPLLSKDDDQYVLHFYDMATKSPFVIYTFAKE